MIFQASLLVDGVVYNQKVPFIRFEDIVSKTSYSDNSTNLKGCMLHNSKCRMKQSFFAKQNVGLLPSDSFRMKKNDEVFHGCSQVYTKCGKTGQHLAYIHKSIQTAPLVWCFECYDMKSCTGRYILFPTC